MSEHDQIAGTPDVNAQSTMQVWRSDQPGVDQLEFARVSSPLPRQGEMLVRVAAAALNFSDLLMIDDKYQVRPERPFTPGQEISGTVVAVGDGVDCPIGARVASKVLHGGFAEYALIRADMAMRVPDGMSLQSAVALPVVYTTAMVALTESTTIKAGETVLALAAAGGVGLAAVQIARDLGARVIAAAGGAEKCALAKANGAHEVVDYRIEGWRDQVMAMTEQRGVDVIVDPVGGDISNEAMRLIGWGGRLLIVGFSSGDLPRIAANRLLLRRASAIGVYWNHDHDGPMLARVARKLSDLAVSGVIKPHIGGVFKFAEAKAALRALGDRKTTGKAVITIAEDAQ